MKWMNKVRFQKGKDKTLIANTQNGLSVFISNECLEYIEEAINLELCLKDFIEQFQDNNDREYMVNLLNILSELEMWEEPDKNKVLNNKINISWDITNECNLRCIHCMVSAGDKKRGCELSTTQLIEIAKKIISINPYSICISGGEPLVRNDFKKIITYIKSNYNGKLKLMTNGLLIDEEMAKFIVDNFFSIDVSIDGVNEETCSIIRGKGVFNKVIHSIKLLKKCGARYISASMLYFEQTRNLREKFIKLCKDKLEVYPIVRFLDESGRGKINSHKLKVNEIEEKNNMEAYKQAFIKTKMNTIAPKVFNCKGADREFQIDQKGDIFPCASLMDEKFVMGNILEIEDFRDYLENKRYCKKNGYKRFEQYKPYNISRCKDCNKNLLCFSCVKDIIKKIEDNSIYSMCELNSNIFNLYWEEKDVL